MTVGACRKPDARQRARPVWRAEAGKRNRGNPVTAPPSDPTCAVGGSRRGVSVPGHRRTGREGRGDRDHQSALLGMDPGHSPCPAVQGPGRPHHRPGAHHRDWHRVLSLPSNSGKAQGSNFSGEHQNLATANRTDQRSQKTRGGCPMKIYIEERGPPWPAQRSWPARCNARRPRIQNLTVFQPTLRAVKGGSKNWYRT